MSSVLRIKPSCPATSSGAVEKKSLQILYKKNRKILSCYLARHLGWRILTQTIDDYRNIKAYRSPRAYRELRIDSTREFMTLEKSIDWWSLTTEGVGSRRRAVTFSGKSLSYATFPVLISLSDPF